ncbi:TPA: hypothetical protein MW252_002806 [Acinetobacter nosocomialis]|nr:hypothetical protein [Acinetobacter nosocomialis]
MDNLKINLERALEIEFIRSELMGPSRLLNADQKIELICFDENLTFRPKEGASNICFWKQDNSEVLQEVISYRRENPFQKYGVGVLYPLNDKVDPIESDTDEDSQGSDEGGDQILMEETETPVVEGEKNFSQVSYEVYDDNDQDFSLSKNDTYRPSLIGVSFCLEASSPETVIVVSLPPEKKFFWQIETALPIQLNGGYELCKKIVNNANKKKTLDAWRRIALTNIDTKIKVKLNDLKLGKPYKEELNSKFGPRLQIELFPRKILNKVIITCVLRNLTDSSNLNSHSDRIKNSLFQSYFEVSLEGGIFSKYPEGVRAFEKLDTDEQNLALLYNDAATWAIGHGCAAAWDVIDGDIPSIIYADCMPAVQLPSMTPDIRTSSGMPISLSMRDLSELSLNSYDNDGWEALDSLIEEYQNWIEKKNIELNAYDHKFHEIAKKNILDCQNCLIRMKAGLTTIRNNSIALEAFKLANQSMLLQQISSKQLEARELTLLDGYVGAKNLDQGVYRTPWEVLVNKAENSNLGTWRAFQAAFLLLSIDGLVNEKSTDREVVDLIWFPTGGGKTEAYLGVAAFYMFYQRLIANRFDQFPRDGTNVFMRYTLRMLTTQQFQRAASLICAMEHIRKNSNQDNKLSFLGEKPFSLGLWVGGDGSPNTWKDAEEKISSFRKFGKGGNPLVLSECPWCRSEIGRLNETITKDIKYKSIELLAGIQKDKDKKYYLKCSDNMCDFGGERSRLPIEVIDQAIYSNPPSMFIGTADKFAMMAWKPETGALFGLKHTKSGPVKRQSLPPGLIIQDEFHLISGPLGTIYGLYEGVIEKLCTDNNGIPPKIIASTATIRGAEKQVKSIYCRSKFQLFPSPGLQMSDSFFGRYATDDHGKLLEGRLYLGIYAVGYNSFLTTQVRTYAAALFRAKLFEKKKRDAWWTLLTFYNSLRELGGARTLFSSDITARLGDHAKRYGAQGDERRHLNSIEELTSRRTQAELVGLMNRLSLDCSDRNAIDACLASNIIEVGVDIDRLALMAVVGQPKSTAQYIQVTGRVGRRWWDRPGLILMMYNPSKSRDLSHFEQFHSYHRRLYERVEPTSATPFSIESVKRAAIGAILLWARQQYDAEQPSESLTHFEEALRQGCEYLKVRCQQVEHEPMEISRAQQAIQSVHDELIKKWKGNPQLWWDYPQESDGEYLMLWSGEHATSDQKRKGVQVLSSMRNVDSSVQVEISSRYFSEEGQ